MKAVIAVDSFKGSISSIQASKAITEGITKADPQTEIVSLPMGDGGEGTVEAIVHATGGVFREKLVTGPLHDKVMATYGISGNGQTAIIEVASACGLTLLTKQQRNPLLTTTLGVGELIVAVILLSDSAAVLQMMLGLVCCKHSGFSFLIGEEMKLSLVVHSSLLLRK